MNDESHLETLKIRHGKEFQSIWVLGPRSPSLVSLWVPIAKCQHLPCAWVCQKGGFGWVVRPTFKLLLSIGAREPLVPWHRVPEPWGAFSQGFLPAAVLAITPLSKWLQFKTLPSLTDSRQLLPSASCVRLVFNGCDEEKQSGPAQ